MCLILCDYNLCSKNILQLIYGLSTKEIEDLWAAVDIDRKGFVDYEEFRASTTLCFSLSLQMQRS